MIRETILATLCLIGIHGPASAAEGMSALREAVTGLPPAVMRHQDRIQAVFVDFSALSTVAGAADLPPEALRRLAFGSELPVLSMLGTYGVDAWSAAAGAAPGEVRSLIGAGRDVVAWRFETPARRMRVIEHLRGRGFAPSGEILLDPGPIQTMARMTDPWRSPRSPGVAVAIGAGALVLAPTGEAARQIAAVQPDGSLAAEPTVRALLAGAEAQIGDGKVVQALFFSPILALRAGDPGSMMGLSPNEAAERMRQSLAAPRPGVPPFLRGMMLDVARPGHAGLLIVLAYPDCGNAEAAGTQVRAKWTTPPARISVRTVPMAEGVCAASILAETEASGLTNPALDALWEAIMRRAPTPLDIG